MQSFVTLIHRLLLVISVLSLVVDLSEYMVRRGKEDAVSKQIPKEFIQEVERDIDKPEITTDPEGGNQVDVRKRFSKEGVSVVLVRGVGTKSRYKNWGFNSTYRDSNNNRVMDIGDVGYVTPGSTMKVIIAYCLYKNKNPSGSMKSVIRQALVVSDNNAANKMIDWVGGVKKVQECFDEEQFKNTFINRKFGSKTPITQRGCKEGSVYGNCSTPEVLVNVMDYLVTGNNTLGLYLTEAKRKELLGILSLRPKDIGSNKPDDYCAFLREKGPQKCGVALLDNSICNLAYVPSKNVIVFVGYRGSKIPDSKMSSVMQSMFLIALEGAVK